MNASEGSSDGIMSDGGIRLTHGAAGCGDSARSGQSAVGCIKKVVSSIVVCLVICLLGPGCTSSSDFHPHQPTSQQQDVGSSETAIAVVDHLDRRVALTKPAEKIVSLAPSLTELLFAIDAGSQVVGVAEFCNFPVEAESLPKIGGGTLSSISREVIVSLSPDLVVSLADSHEPLIDVLESLEIPVVALGADSMDQLFSDTRALGQLTGHQENAAELVTEMQDRLAGLKSRVAGVPSTQRRRVFYEVWDDPLITAGPSTFIGEMLRLGGMENIFADVDQRYPKVSSEVVVARQPDLILAPSTHAQKVTLESLAERQGWGSIPAIRNRDVHLIDGDKVSRCGPRLLDALEEMIDAAYPPTPDVVEISK